QRALHPHGLCGALERRGEVLGLPLPWLAFRCVQRRGAQRPGQRAVAVSPARGSRLMSAGGWAYAGYLAWLAAGSLDFIQHRRTDLARTSGLAGSRWHAVQIGLLGGGVLAWLALAPGLGLMA